MPNGKCVFDGCDVQDAPKSQISMTQQGTGHHFHCEGYLCETHLELVENQTRRRFLVKWEVSSQLPPSQNYSLPAKITHIARKQKG